MVMSFTEYLVEAVPETRYNKLMDVSRMHLLNQNHESVGQLADILQDAHNHLLGKKSNTEFHHQMESEPHVEFGHDNEGKFWVATPETGPSYSKSDVDANHGHNPKEAERMHAALEHLGKIMPKKGGSFAGGIVHISKDVEKNKNHYHVTPADTTYSIHKDHAEAKRMKNAKIGVIVHTKYKDGMPMPMTGRDMAKMDDHPDVHVMDTANKANVANYTPKEQLEYMKHMDAATDAYRKFPPEGFEFLKGHGLHMALHSSKMSRGEDVPDSKTYASYLSNKQARSISESMVDVRNERKNQKYANLIQQVHDNKKYFDGALKMHHHLEKAKRILVGVMQKNNPYIHSKNGKLTNEKSITCIGKDGLTMSKMDR